MTGPDTDGVGENRTVDILERLRGGGRYLETTAVGQGTDLSDDRIEHSLYKLESVLARNVVENAETAFGSSEAKAFLGIASEGLNRLAHQGATADLSIDHVVGLEAIIEIDGSRPSILIRNGWFDESDPRLEPWAGDLAKFSHSVQTAIRSTGRLVVNGDISSSGVHGTVFVVAPGLVATAKHVVEQTFVQDSEGRNDWFIRSGDFVEVDFHVEAGATPRPEKRIQVTGVHWASPDFIGTSIQPKNLDFALLQLAEEGPPR